MSGSQGYRVIVRLLAAFAIAGMAARAAAQEGPLTLEGAIALARVNGQLFRSAQAAYQIATEDRKQAKGALFPALSEFNQFIYTQPNGTPSGVWVPNDGPRLYGMWLAVHGDLYSPEKLAAHNSAAAAELVARAKADVAARGLVATVVQSYYGLVAAIRKAAAASQGLQEAQQFLTITQQQETAGETAHSDVIKAQIQQALRQREAQDAEVAALKARLGLSVLVFPDFRDAVAVVDDLQDVPVLPPLDEVKAKATDSSPELKAADAAVHQGESEIGVARGGVLPSLSFDYFYGINANQFATTSPEGYNLLGSVVQAQVAVPLWNWGAAQSKIRQAELRVQQAKADLTLTQRQLLANVTAFYAEAQAARDQAASLRISVDLATESLRLTLLRYQSGDATVLEVVDAQNTLIDTRNAYDDGLVRYRVALAALQTLTGML